MPIMALREFNCTLCPKTFEKMSGDLIIPEPDLCDDCLREVWQMDGDALIAYIAERLPEDAMFSVEKIVHHTQTIQRNADSAEQAIQKRKSMLMGFA
ncbi:MAG: hypothetical protein PVF83_09085 [Anaerolineales bacterium]|jgi:hypothetical protein